MRPFMVPAIAIIEKNMAPLVANSSRLYQMDKYKGAAWMKASKQPTRMRRPATVCQF